MKKEIKILDNKSMMMIVTALTLAYIGEFTFKYGMGIEPCTICEILEMLVNLVAINMCVIVFIKRDKLRSILLKTNLIIAFTGIVVAIFQYYLQFTGSTIGCTLENLCNESPIVIGNLIYSSVFTFIIFVTIFIGILRLIRITNNNNNGAISIVIYILITSIAILGSYTILGMETSQTKAKSITENIKVEREVTEKGEEKEEESDKEIREVSTEKETGGKVDTRDKVDTGSVTIVGYKQEKIETISKEQDKERQVYRQSFINWEYINQMNDNKYLVVATYEYCDDCKKVKKQVEKYMENIGDYRIYNIDVGDKDNREQILNMGIENVPAFILVEEGEVKLIEEGVKTLEEIDSLLKK